jgi:uncharacterized protein YjbI with pentapeptide repeats
MTTSIPTKNTLDERLTASRKTLETKYVFPASTGVIVVMIVIWIGSKIFGGDIDGYWMNLFSEGLGIAITILVIDRLNEYRAEQRYKQDLIRHAGSISNDIAVDAIEQLRKAGWLTGTDGVLKGAFLLQANLEKARMSKANLQDVSLILANLQNADLSGANLQNADLLAANLHSAWLWETNLQSAQLNNTNLQSAQLRNTNLQSAHLYEANLQLAHMRGANLQAAVFYKANLQAADLVGANLQAADLRTANLQSVNLALTDLTHVLLTDAKFDEKTVLPDSEYQGDDTEGNSLYDKYWTPTTDMTRYTNLNHPDYWNPHPMRAKFGWEDIQINKYG